MSEVVVALDSFKGSIDARSATAALARGLRRHPSGPVVHEHPVGDGGEGTLAALTSVGFVAERVVACDPLGRPVDAHYAHRDGVAFVELAEASGLGRLTGEVLGPATAETASTCGTGRLIAAALEAGHHTVVVGLGGSATTDGGSGLLAALGARLLDESGRPLCCHPAPLASVVEVDLSRLHPGLRTARLVLACDVDNPLLGPHGAASVYGPQKGADEETVARLERSLTRWAGLLEDATGVRAAGTAGAGAAGGAGFALLALGAEKRRGIDLVLELTGLAGLLPGAGLVITGEGTLDHQTLRGKAPAGIAAAARAAGTPVVAVAGRNLLAPQELTDAGFAAAFALTDLEPDVGRCLTDAASLLEQVGERIADEHFRARP
ncbi:glycerate kinase [Lentzea sp. NPDC058436]|uniref:glycerate kinase n=1 Tax=Lentzea sp. NPDC058436 TaxID=3346499 RepID=UPI00364BEAC0